MSARALVLKMATYMHAWQLTFPDPKTARQQNLRKSKACYLTCSRSTQRGVRAMCPLRGTNRGIKQKVCTGNHSKQIDLHAAFLGFGLGSRQMRSPPTNTRTPCQVPSVCIYIYIYVFCIGERHSLQISCHTWALLCTGTRVYAHSNQ